MSHPAERDAALAWIFGAHLAHQRIVVAFEASHTRGRQRKLPSTTDYAVAIRMFHRAHPEISDIQPWNEVNRCQRKLADGSYVGQPTCHSPRRAALYYLAARRVFKHARVTGLDILDQASVGSSVRYVKAFLKYARPRPRFWGFHNYSDTNHFGTARTRALLKATRSGQVWLTETGGIVSLGSGYPYDTKRAAKALGCMFTIARSSHRITRVYVYDFNGSSRGRAFDAGLINPDQTLRPGYDIVLRRKAGRCHK
jgi:hypothetical protein